MISFFKKNEPVIRQRAEHCISRSNIDADALKVLHRLATTGYTAYLVGGSVRDLLLGRQPKDFDVGTNARPNELRRIFRNCFLIGRRFRLAHIVFGRNIIETSTFRCPPPAEADGSYQTEDNTFGTPEEDAKRRDFTVNGLFYDIVTFAVIDYVGGLKDLEKKTLRSIGDPNIRFREDPVRMMRAVKFAARLGFTIERSSLKAILKHHAEIRNCTVPRVCEEVSRLFTYNSAAPAFRLLWELKLMGDILPELAAYVDESGGEASPLWGYLAALDAAPGSADFSNGMRCACLCYPYFVETLRQMEAHTPNRRNLRQHAIRAALAPLAGHLRVPKSTLFTAHNLLEAQRRFEAPPQPGHTYRFLFHNTFPEALALHRVTLAAEGLDAALADQWQALHEKEAANHPLIDPMEEEEGGEAKGGFRSRRRRRRRRGGRGGRGGGGSGQAGD